MYGLKQAPRAWFDKFSSVLEKEGYCRSVADFSLFVKKTSIGIVSLQMYVDEILITGDDESEILKVSHGKCR